ncbi:hypothetical protein ES703_59782 [subsurface metagenome]
MGQVHNHVIPQVVKAELATGAVGNVRLISLAAGDRPEMTPLAISGVVIGVIKAGGSILIRALLGIDTGDTHPQGTIDRPHPVGVAPGEIVVDCRQMTTPAGKRVEIDGKGSYQSLTFAGLHLGNFALVKDNTPHQLHVKVALAYRPLGSLPDRSKSLGQKLVKRTAFLKPCPELVCFSAKPVITEPLKFSLKPVYPLYCRLEPLQLFLIGINQPTQPLKHNPSPRSAPWPSPPPTPRPSPQTHPCRQR